MSSRLFFFFKQKTAYEMRISDLSSDVCSSDLLEAENVIVGYTVRLRPDAQPEQISAWMSIAIDGNETRRVISMLLGEPGVAALHDTNGRWDLLAELRAQSIAEMSEILERVRLIQGIAATETSLHLKGYKADRKSKR